MCIVQTMNILIVNQSIVDLSASFFTLLTAVVEVDGTRMSPDSTTDQFICRTWLTRTPLWCFLFTSTYGILLMALERYAAVIYHVWYNNSVRTAFICYYRTQNNDIDGQRIATVGQRRRLSL